MLKLQDTLSGEFKELPPLPHEVTLYVCGITPYSGSHIGHAVPAIVFDVLRRYLEYRGYTVRHVQNFTDIDDKLIDRAEATGTTVKALADQYSEQYMGSLTRLNVKPATLYPRATEEVPRIIEIVEGLIAKDFAYASGGDVYYRVRKKADYGKLSHRNIDDLRSGERVADTSELKDDPLDFALWKAAKPGEPSWESPWGPGRPGWHIECSAMSYGHLGAQIDIHGGGADLIFPHHENEIAQTEGFTGVAPFARIWMHNALLKMGAEKMSKSLGNIKDLDEVVAAYGPDAIRTFILASHYRSPLTYAEDALEAAKVGAQRLREAAFAAPTGASSPGSLSEAINDPGQAARERFEEAMDDDLNTSKALAALFELARFVNRARDGGQSFAPAQAVLRELAGILGFTLAAPPVSIQGAEPFIQLLIDVRTDLRAAKQWAPSDRIRDGLQDLGVELKDGPEGTTFSAR
ncbi:MAG: cysteine--tRNA ligase [Dehalococcoidia bacterium]